MGIKLRFLKNVSLSRFTTFRVGGVAKDFFIANTTAEICEAYSYYAGKKMVLGGGSNVLISDSGFDGLIVLNRTKEMEFFFTKSGECVCRADSGVLISRLSRYFMKLGFGGLSFAAQLPGTLGGAVKGNAGAFNGCMSDIVDSVSVLRSDGSISVLDNAQCGFSYRKSLIDGVILSITLHIEPKDIDLIKAETLEFMEKRKQTQPIGKSAGCIFKSDGEFSAGYYIDKAGLKGYNQGGAYVSSVHANFIMNDGTATASAIKELIDKVKITVKEMFDVSLNEEIVLIGEF